MRLHRREYRQWTWRIAIAACAVVAIPGWAAAQCANGGGQAGGGTGTTTAGGGLQSGGASASQVSFALQLLHMQQQAIQQAQMQELMRRQRMSHEMGASGFARPAVPPSTTANDVGAAHQPMTVRPDRPLTEVQRRRIEREEARQREIEERVAERERETAERIAEHQQHLARLRAVYEAE